MNQCILDEWQAWEVLHYLHKKGESVRKLAEKLGVGKSTVHRVLRREQPPPGIVRVRLCELLPEEELLKILRGPQILRAYNLVDDEGRLNKAVILAVIDAVMQDERFRDEVLSYLLKYYKKELTEKLVETLPKIQLRWTPEFESWLTEKKSKPLTQRTLRDYYNYWRLCLEGKTLGWHLIKQLSGNRMLCYDGEYHPTGWLRQVFRHYIRFLYAQGRLDWDSYSRLMLVIPGRRYGRKLAQKPINTEDVIRTLKMLREKRMDIYTLYAVMVYSAVRFEHALNTLKTWSPDETLYVPYLARNIKRLECLDTHCRYYLGGETDRKPRGFMFFPRALLPLVEEHGAGLPGRRRVEKVVARLGGLMPKYVRIFAIREMRGVFGETDVWRFVTGKFGELSVSARHYRDLLAEADTIYPRYVEYLSEVLRDALNI